MQLRVCVLVLSGFCLLSLSKAREDVTEHSMAAGISLEACGCLETSCWVRKQGKGSPVSADSLFPMFLLCRHNPAQLVLSENGGCWEWNLGPLEQQPVVSTAEPSLQPRGGSFSDGD